MKVSHCCQKKLTVIGFCSKCESPCKPIDPDDFLEFFNSITQPKK